MNWRSLAAGGFAATLDVRTGLFYVLTGLHGLHVIGGLAPLLYLTSRSLALAATAPLVRGVRHCALYWHFLDVVWLSLLAVIVLAR
jgi:cytochrome c oxidase subunit 3